MTGRMERTGEVKQGAKDRRSEGRDERRDDISLHVIITYDPSTFRFAPRPAVISTWDLTILMIQV